MFKQRLAYIDFLKGVAILLVILGHCIQYTDCNFCDNILYQYIHSFHMPLFMFLSGYVSYKGILQFSSIKKRAIQLLVPFFVWPSFSQILDMKFVDFSVYRDIVLHPESGLWFLWSLFFITVFLFVFDNLSKKIHIRQEYIVCLGVMVLLCLGFVLKGKINFGLNITSWYMIFYMQGFYMRKYQCVLISFFRKYAFVFFVIFLISAYFMDSLKWGTFLPVRLVYIFSIGYRLFVATMGTFSFYLLGQKFIGDINHNNLIRMINEIGGRTLGIYCIQFKAIKWSKELFVSSNLFLQILISFIAATLISIMLEWMFSQNKYTAFLFVGKNRFKMK